MLQNKDQKIPSQLLAKPEQQNSMTTRSSHPKITMTSNNSETIGQCRNQSCDNEAKLAEP